MNLDNWKLNNWDNHKLGNQIRRFLLMERMGWKPSGQIIQRGKFEPLARHILSKRPNSNAAQVLIGST